MRRKPYLPLTLLALAGTVPMIAVGPSFVPDVTFTGSSLAGWHTVGNAEWRAENGEIVGKPTAASGGWLVLDKSYQDVGVYVEYRCTDGCQTGVLFRGTKGDTGMKGTFVDLADPQIPTYSVVVGADGSMSSRDRAGNGGVGAIHGSASSTESKRASAELRSSTRLHRAIAVQAAGCKSEGARLEHRRDVHGCESGSNISE
jgi:hypothetical protein